MDYIGFAIGRPRSKRAECRRRLANSSECTLVVMLPPDGACSRGRVSWYLSNLLHKPVVGAVRDAVHVVTYAGTRTHLAAGDASSRVSKQPDRLHLYVDS